MTDPAIIAASYAAERNYSHNPDDIIDSSDAVGAWGTTKESTTELVDLSGNGNIADIHGPMPTEGFIQGRRFTAANSDFINFSDVEFNKYVFINGITVECLLKVNNTSLMQCVGRGDDFRITLENNNVIFSITNTEGEVKNIIVTSVYNVGEYMYIAGTFDNSIMKVFFNCENGNEIEQTDIRWSYSVNIGHYVPDNRNVDGVIVFSSIKPITTDENTLKTRFNTFARLPFWSINYTDYPDNVTEYTDNLPYSSSIISSGTFKVDDDKLQCMSAGTITYRASYNFDGSEYVKVTIDDVEYAGTGTITQGNTTVSVAQGSNKVTITMGTGDAIKGEIGIQFRQEV